ncbi:MAG: hypothetical protein FJ147_26720 [Deltaproteobacteria bacterium]|nr:hypothetical protein [Deltaproteobacteria bacterium]
MTEPADLVAMNETFAFLSSAHRHARDPLTKWQEGTRQEFRPFAWKDNDRTCFPIRVAALLRQNKLGSSTVSCAADE